MIVVYVHNTYLLLKNKHISTILLFHYIHIMSTSESKSSNSSETDGELEAAYNRLQATRQQLQQALQQRAGVSQPQGSRSRRRRTHIEIGRE